MEVKFMVPRLALPARMIVFAGFGAGLSWGAVAWRWAA